MSIFDNASQVNIFENSAYFQPGRYIVRIDEVKMITGGFKGDSFVVQGTVLGAKSDEASAPSVGMTAAHVWSVSGDKREMGRATWFGFLCGVYGVAQSEYSDAQWKQVSEKVIEGALNGTQVNGERTKAS